MEPRILTYVRALASYTEISLLFYCSGEPGYKKAVKITSHKRVQKVWGRQHACIA